MIARLRTLAKALAPSTSTQPAVPRTQQGAGESGSPLDMMRPASRAHLNLEAAVLRCVETEIWPETIVRFVREALEDAGEQVPASEQTRLDADDRARLFEIANSIQLVIEDDGVHADFAARDVRFLRALADRKPQPESGSGEEGEKGQCATCGAMVALADDGTVESHRAPKQLSGVCFGTSREPAPETLVQCDICDRQIPEESARFDGEAYFCTECVEPSWNEPAPTQPLQGSEVEREGDRWVIWKNDSGQGISSGPDIEPERPGLMGAEWARAATAMVMRVSEFHERHEEIERLTLERDMARGQSGLKPFTGDDGEQYSPATPREQQYLAASVVSQRKAKELEAQLQRVEGERDRYAEAWKARGRQINEEGGYLRRCTESAEVRATQAEAALEEAAKEFERNAEGYARKRAECRAAEHSFEATWNYYEGLRRAYKAGALRLREKQAALSKPPASTEGEEGR